MTRWARENDFDVLIAGASQRYGVPIPIIKAVIAIESGFNPRAYRIEAPRASLPPTPDHPAGGDASYGLMQVLARTARSLGFVGPLEDLFDPAVNIALGTRLLQQHLRRTASLADSVSAYNGGFRPALGFGAQLPTGRYRNQDYVDRFFEAYRYFLAREGGSGTDSPPFPGGGIADHAVVDTRADHAGAEDVTSGQQHEQPCLPRSPFVVAAATGLVLWGMLYAACCR